MRIVFFCLFSILIISSCQKELRDDTIKQGTDSSSTAALGQLIGMKVFYLNGVDTLPEYFYEFRYDSNPRKLIEYRHQGNIRTKQFDLNNDSANKVWTYNSNNLLVEEAGFLNSPQNITYTNKIGRVNGGDLFNFEYPIYNYFLDCSSSQYLINTAKIAGKFTTQIKNGLKEVRYLDTLTGDMSFGNQQCDYTAYFDAAGRIKTKVINGIMLIDPSSSCTKFKYFPVNDTAQEFFYDPSTGKLTKSILSYYSGHVGSTPKDMDRITYTFNYQYDKRDNNKISQFFTEYFWGKDLQSWFSYGSNAGATGGGADDWLFPPEFQHLNFGICEKVNYTAETFSGGISSGVYSSEVILKNEFDAKGNLIHCSAINGAINDYYYEFIYKGQ